MTFQIRAIHLFNSRGDRRSIELRLGEVNIITGRSATGKSSIVDIISYCFGSDEFHVAAGVIRNNVSKYAVELVDESQIIILARNAPSAGRRTTTQLHLSAYARDERPQLRVETLEPNHDLRSARSALGALMGIPDVTTDVGLGTRREFEIGPKHALFFCLQSQGEIASPDILFHGQADEWVPQAIRDVLPFFLGVVDPMFVAKRSLLQQKERALRVAERNLNDERALRGQSGRALTLLREAAQVGLVDEEDVEALAEGGNLTELMSRAVRSDATGDLDSGEVFNDLTPLEEERSALREELGQLRVINERLRGLARSQVGFEGEARVQRERLMSLDLVERPESRAEDSCPLCGSAIADAGHTLRSVREELEQVSRQLGEVAAGVPHVQQLLAENERRVAEVDERLSLNAAAINSWLSSRELFDSLRERSLRQAAVRGRLALYLESVNPVIEASFARQDLERLREEIDALRRDLDIEASRVRMDGVLSRVSHVMTEVSRRLKLEHAPSPARIDVGELTVVVDTPAESIELREIGSAENWLGYHLAALLALHQRFIESQSPVFRFLVLDQPSQVYFPPDSRVDVPELNDDDRAALWRFYSELLRFVRMQNGTFQILVLDHADEAEDWFQDAVIERWRGGAALVPGEWIEPSAELL
ncbi:hypothetical protein CELL_01986 [Cellulomonas sp. T2.31MG-18]|uniref:DUF3732 domain-containing protein n=1 Tax=Cellulomonas sp. T2.31MG-18 TaxID=3157619 RepID=UPI0035ECB0FA